jgi:hypothetical protein
VNRHPMPTDSVNFTESLSSSAKRKLGNSG